MAAKSGQGNSTATRRKVAVSVTQNDAKRDHAAILFAEDEMQPQAQRRRSDQSIADETDVSRSTITRWKRDPEFQAMIQDAKGKIVADALRLPSAQKHQRIRNLHGVADGILRVFALRAERYSQEADTPEQAARRIFGRHVPPEAATGLLVEKSKISASGQTITDWEMDTGAITKLESIYKHIAQETGQWEETVNVNHSGDAFHDARYEAASVATLEKIDHLLSGDE